MMDLGIFAKTFRRNSLADILDAIVQKGLSRIQFNMSCAGLKSMPDQIDPALATDIGYQCRQRNIRMDAVSGTFNMAHPDERTRRQGLERLRILAQASSLLGTRVITLCTGSRDTENMWQWHPENAGREAWRDMMASLMAAASIAEQYNIVLGIEPERANVVSDARLARKLLDELRSPNVKIVMDAANLFNPAEERPMRDVLEEGFDLLGEHIVIAHAKDIAMEGELRFAAAGQGILDYGHYLRLLASVHFDGALILHGLEEDQVEGSLQYISNAMRERGRFDKTNCH